RADDQLRWTDPATGYVRRQVAPAPGSDLPLELVQVELPAGASGRFPPPAYAVVRPGGWGLGGPLTFLQGGAARTLAPGDCLELGPPSDCTFRNDKKRSCRYAVVILRQAQ